MLFIVGRVVKKVKWRIKDKMERVCKRCGRREYLKYKKPRSPYCRKCQVYLGNVKRRIRLKNEKRCLNCGVKVKPVLVYHKRCRDCLDKGKK